MCPPVPGAGVQRDTSITQITEGAGVTRGSFQNLFHTKDAVLMELVETMFGGQFGAARRITGGNCRRSMPMRWRRPFS